ncbi:hypothetical protein GOP47_0029964 [Adiantum capillus-veneris]|nr:hypothetical protein GOP47_0029964 [Adiantum capillus-veneris]
MQTSSLYACAIIVLLFPIALNPSHTSAKDVYYLGFLSPYPSPNGDSLIPMQLAQQWQSAFQVALEVLNSENRTYQLEAVLADTSCSWMKVLSLSHVLDQTNLIGVVGPACSGAALSATQYFEQETPIVSFAATHESLSNRNNYPNFFRTVYGDKHQTLAMLSVMEKLEIWNATIICAKDYYSLSLASSIQQLVIQRVLSMRVLDVGDNSSVSASQIKEILNSLNPSNVVILALPPSIAKDFWTVAMQTGKTVFPWWYFGTDGVTALDPSIDGSLELAQALQGEIGLAPQGGDTATLSLCKKFFDYWKEKGYPGLPSSGLDNSRSYVTHLIDTVALYFEIVDALVKSNVPVNASTVLSALQGSGTGSPNFKGCTGVVQIDPETGSRRVSASQPAVYQFVSWVNSSWELNGRVHEATFISLQPLVRPMGACSNVEIGDGTKGQGTKGGWIDDPFDQWGVLRRRQL